MNRSVLVSIILAFAAFAWVLSGTLAGSTEPVAEVTEAGGQSITTVPAMRVTVSDLTASDVANEIKLQGQVESARDVELRVEVSGRVLKHAAKKGQRLALGDTIIQLDLSDRLARLEQAKAELALREADLAASASLKQKRMISDNQHKQAEAHLAAARAAVKQVEVEISNTRIVAPFGGILNELNEEVGAYLVPGDKVGTLVDDSYLLITANVPQQHIAKLALDMPVSAQLLGGGVLQGKISYLSSNADPDTRTYRLEAKVARRQVFDYFGQSAAVSIQLAQASAHRISPALLDLAASGELQVKGVDSDNRVIVYPVDILRSDLDGVWVRGLPPRARLITVGQGFVSPGQIVAPVLAAGEEG